MPSPPTSGSSAVRSVNSSTGSTFGDGEQVALVDGATGLFRFIGWARPDLRYPEPHMVRVEVTGAASRVPPFNKADLIPFIGPVRMT